MKRILLSIGLAGGVLAATHLPAANAPETNSPAAVVTQPTPPPDDQPGPPPDDQPGPPDDTPQPPGDQPDSATNTPPATPLTRATNDLTSATNYVPDTNIVAVIAPGERGLRMNFRNAPLEAVLKYMSAAAGFIIHPKTDVNGKVTVWSDQPLTSDEAVVLLKQILAENNYTVLAEGKTLTIIRTGEAKYNDIRTISYTGDPDQIPKTSEVATAVLPVHSLNAVQLVKDFQPLIPADSTTLTADDSANSLLMTGPMINIHRVAEILKALDSVNSSAATIMVFPLLYADSKSLASLIKDLFPSQDTTARAGGGGGFNFGRFRGGGGPGGGFNPFGGGGNNNDTENNGHTPTAKVSAVSDDHSNSLIVSAPDVMADTISNLVHSVDKSVEDTSVVHIFHLKNADATEMVDLLTSLFPDDSNTATDATRPQFQFGRFNPFGGGQQNASASSTTSDRMKRLAKVVAVADRRTSSLVVTANKDMMPNIVEMIEDLDQRKDRKMSAHYVPLANADPVDVQQILQEQFPPSTTSSASRSGSSSANSSLLNPLLNRAQTLLQQQNSQNNNTIGGSTTGSTRN